MHLMNTLVRITSAPIWDVRIPYLRNDISNISQLISGINFKRHDTKRTYIKFAFYDAINKKANQT